MHNDAVIAIALQERIVQCSGRPEELPPMPALTTTIAALPYALPACPNARIALFALRRMGAQGLHDARASHALFTAFGQEFRRPLVLMRALMADLAGTAAGTIAIAPCCCARMTAAERTMLTILASVE